MQESRSAATTLTDWNRTWELGQQLRAAYGVRDAMLGSPRVVAINAREAGHLNQYLLWSINGEHIRDGRFRSGEAVVQPVHSCMSPTCLLFGCDKHTAFAGLLQSFVCTQVDNTSKLLYELEQSIDSSKAMLEATDCLHLDFQALMRNDGAIFQIDLDRCFEPMVDDEGRTIYGPSSSELDHCLDDVLELVRLKVSYAESGRC